MGRRYNDNVLFNPVFPKTGGGEDIDYCLKKKEFFIKNVENGKPFIGAPNVIITHPWWNNGNKDYKRFYLWATGDGRLVKMYPELSYNDLAPNSAELLFGSILFFIITVLFSLSMAIFYGLMVLQFRCFHRFPL